MRYTLENFSYLITVRYCLSTDPENIRKPKELKKGFKNVNCLWCTEPVLLRYNKTSKEAFD